MNKENVCKSFGERHGLDIDPITNTLNENEFQDRVKKVFNTISTTIGKSLGPGGKTTFISNYPYIHPTKDGYTIMKNLSFQSQLDQIISDMADTVCSRLNYTVGDGTTSAIMATNSVYDSVVSSLERFDYYKSREVSQAFSIIKDEIINRLYSKANNIRTDDPDELVEHIAHVAAISSNNNNEIVRIMIELYRELMYPAISVVLSKEGVTRGTVINGYPAEVMLTDQLYINNDNKTMLLNNSDVIIFDHKVTESTYQNIIKPLNFQCKARERHLIVIAPFYDETALTGVIRRDILDEYNKNKDVNLILTVCRHMSANHKSMISDLAMLLNTDIISLGMEDEITRGVMNRSNGILYYINIDERYIPNTIICAADMEQRKLYTVLEEDRPNHNFIDFEKNDDGTPTDIKRIRLGFVGTVELGLNQSTFMKFIYNEDLYEKTVNEARSSLQNTINTYKRLGNFTTEIAEKQKRLFRLSMKMGIIEVGGESDISQKYNKDAIDDTVRATESAYNNGVVSGSHVTMITIINDMIKEARNITIDNLDEKAIQNNKLLIILLSALKNGFISVYESVLSNAGISGTEATEIINKSIESGITYNIETQEFDGRVINSCETDVEILRAVIDLVGLISTSNQLVICEQRGA